MPGEEIRPIDTSGPMRWRRVYGRASKSEPIGLQPARTPPAEAVARIE